MEDKKIYLGKILNTSYMDVKNPNDSEIFLEILSLCYYIKKYYDTKDLTHHVLVSKYTMVYSRLPKNIKMGGRFSNCYSPETIKHTASQFISERSEELCSEIMSYYKKRILSRVLRESDILVNIVKYFLSNTVIGGREIRGFDPKEVDSMIKIALKKIDEISILYTDKFKFCTDKKIRIESKDIDEIGKYIHSVFSSEQMELKMENAEKLHLQKIINKKSEDSFQEWLDSDNKDEYIVPDFSKLGNQCINNCIKHMIGGEEICACPVKIKGWTGDYIRIQECDSKKCN